MSELNKENKKKIVVLVNDSINNAAYIAFLATDYEVKTVGASKWGGEHLDLILFTGGEDVSPKYYKQNVGKYTGVNEQRDKFERDYMFDRFYNVPKLGICRGSQLVTAFSGGKLIQHVTGHAVGKLHEIEMKGRYGSNIFNITSTHHQMLYPYNLDEKKYEIIATSKYYLSNTYLNGNNEETKLPKNFEECEIVFYPESNSLGIQGHPEMGNCPEETKSLCLKLIKNILKL